MYFLECKMLLVGLGTYLVKPVKKKISVFREPNAYLNEKNVTNFFSLVNKYFILSVPGRYGTFNNMSLRMTPV